MLATLLQSLALGSQIVAIPLPGGGEQRFLAPSTRPALRAAASTPKSVSFKFDPPFLYRLYTSVDLVNWSPAGEATREPTILFECAPTEPRRFWRVVQVVEL